MRVALLPKCLLSICLVVPALLGTTPAGAAPPWGAAISDHAPLDVKVGIRRLTERVWFVEGLAGAVSPENQGFNSNAGFVVTDDGVVVFDALGSPALGAALLARIREVTDQPVRRVIISHYHADHFYGVQAFKAIGAEVWAHEAVARYLISDAPVARLAERRQSLFPWVDERTMIVAPDRLFRARERFSLGNVDFRLLHAGPAHTPEDTMMLVEQEQVLFAGDLIFAGRVPFVGDADSRGWLTALDELATLAPRIVIPGHGPASMDAVADLALTRDYLRHLRAAMGRAVDDMESFDDAYAATDWSAYEALPAFEQANRRNAYNTFLLMEREALSGRRR